MVVSNDIISQINYIKDIEIQFEIKLLLLLFFIISALISLYFAYKNDYETQSRGIFNYLMLSYGYLVLIFLPLYLFFLNRSVPLDTILQYIGTFYVIFFTGLLSIGVLYVIEVGMQYFFGVSFIDKKKSRRSENDYRKVESKEEK